MAVQCVAEAIFIGAAGASETGHTLIFFRVTLFLDLLVAKSGLHEKFKTNISLLLDLRHSCNPIIVRGGLLVHSAFKNEFIL